MTNRRTFLARCATAAASTSLCYRPAVAKDADAAISKSDRPVIGLIGAGWQPDWRRQGRGIAIGKQATKHAELATICDVDSVALDYAVDHIAKHSGADPAAIDKTDDYRRVLDRQDIDAVLIATPDHWHAKIAIEAMQAGKDVYLEKPATVTIDEGKQLVRAVRKTQRVLQVGTQQRTEYGGKFLQAIAMVREGRIGKLKRVHIGLEQGWKGDPMAVEPIPKTLDWDRWLGPAPMTNYLPRRTHRTFRWWYEYAGGQLCDWGAHHVDIAQWAIGALDQGPMYVEGTAEMNQPMDSDGMPRQADRYNTPVTFSVKAVFRGDMEMLIDSSRNGITFEGERGRFFVNRGKIEGAPVTALADDPLPADAIAELTPSSGATSHMDDFFRCVVSRNTPQSDIYSHHRTLTTCHLANLSLRLGRRVHWDPQAQAVSNSRAAQALLKREYRSGYELPEV